MSIQILSKEPSWGGMVVYLNSIMKWYGIIPKSNLYFNKSHISPMRAAPGLYLGNPNKKTIGWIKVKKFRNLMKARNIDVAVVDLPSILESTQYRRELFLIQGFVRRGGKLRKDKNGVPDPVPMWKASRGKKDDDYFYEHTMLVEPSIGRYIDHVLCSRNGCLILNPASHLRVYDNLERGYFKEINFVVKLTYTKSEDTYSEMDMSVEGVSYHTKEE
jgi:hypothetical protein